MPGNWIQVEHICETPIILFGPMWGPLLEWLRNEVLARELIHESDLRMIFYVNEVEKVIALIRKIYKDRSANGHVCENSEKYKIELGLQGKL